MLRDRNTVKMVAEYWGVSSTTVYRLIDTGALAALRLGGAIRITREQVEACETASNTAPRLDQERKRAEAFRHERDFQHALETTRHQKFGFPKAVPTTPAAHRALARSRRDRVKKRPLWDQNTLKDVAQRWGCSVGAVEWQIIQGRLRCIRIGRRTLLSREAVEDCEDLCAVDGKHPGVASKRRKRGTGGGKPGPNDTV